MPVSPEQELRNIRAMPYGTARIAAAESIARRIETDGPEERLAEALLDLVEAYTFAGQGAKSFVVFARLLRWWDSRPEMFDEGDVHNLFWEFKWVASDLSDFPEIAGPQAEAFLDDMERRYALAGHGSSAVAMSRFTWAWHSGSPGAEAARIAWATAPRDEFDDCRACTIGQQVDYFTEQGRWREAVELGLQQDAKCNLEPAKSFHALALSALLAGEPELALRSLHRATAALDDGSRDIAPALAQGFETLARGGLIERALRQLRVDYPQLLTEPNSPLYHLRFLLGVLAGLSANLDRADLETGLRTPGHGTVGELHDWARTTAAALAERFDRRGGSAYYAGLLQRALEAERTELPLEAGGAERGEPEAHPEAGAAERGEPEARAADDAGAGGAGTGAGDADTGPDRGSRPAAAELFRDAEALASQREFGRAAALYLEAAAAFEEGALLERAGIAHAEAAQCAALSGDDETAHGRFAAALPLLRAGGADGTIRVAVLVAWAPIAARMAEPLPHLAATEAELAGYVEFDAAGLSGDLAERRRSEWIGARAELRDALARSIAAADPERLPEGLDAERAVTEASTAAEEFAGIGRTPDAAHAFWLAGRVQRDAGDTAGALWSFESAFEGFAAAGLRSRRVEAADDFIALLRESGQAERAEAVVAQLAEG